jgi:hypothetical protein
MYFTVQDYYDYLGRCERMGEYVPESELTEVTADNGVKLLLCGDCVEELGVGIK